MSKMKTLLTSLIVIGFVSFAANAQILELGVANSRITMEESFAIGVPYNLSFTSTATPGLHAGLGYQVNVNNYFGVVLEASYTQSRGTIELPVFSEVAYKITSNVKADIISIGLLPKLSYDFSFITLYEMAGPQFEFQIKEKERSTLELPNTEFVVAVVGLGVELPVLSPLVFGFDVKYHPFKQALNTTSSPPLTLTISREPLLEFALTIRIK